MGWDRAPAVYWKLIIDLYNAAILEATGNPHIPQSYWKEVLLFIPQSQRVLVKDNIPKHSIHTSGHAGPKELKELVQAMKPERVVPIHNFHPEQYAELFPNVETHDDGEWWEV